jgi:phosphoribosylformylglycinamidine synthase
MDAKSAGGVLVLVGATQEKLGGSHYQRLFGIDTGYALMPKTDLDRGPATARAVAKLIGYGLVRSAHDVSDGGALCAIAEMLIAGSRKGQPIGANVDFSGVYNDSTVAAFSESPSRYVLEVSPDHLQRVIETLRSLSVFVTRVGTLDASGVLRADELKLSVVVGDLTSAWLGTLDW